MTVISTDKLLFWLTPVSLFTLGAWERTSGQRSLHGGGSAFSNFVAEEDEEGEVRASAEAQKRADFDMQGPSSTFVLQLCLTLGVSIGSCACKPLGNDIQSEEFYSELSEEGEPDSWMEKILGTTKQGFLRKLNLSDVPQEQGRICPPPFMMELYNKYASDRSAIPQSDVIRSFTVQGTGTS